jgi:membrane protein
MIAEWFAEKRASSPLLSFTASVADEFMADRIPLVAAGVTFFVLLALFPAIGAIAALFGFFGDRTILSSELAGFAGVLPGGALKVLAAEMTRLAALKVSKIGLAFVISLSIALWSASGGVTSLIDGLNIALEVKERRSYFGQLMTAVTIVAAAIAFGVALTEIVALFAPFERVVNAPGHAVWLIAVMRWTAVLILAIAFNVLIYRYAPDRPRAERRWISWGSVISALLWVIGSAAFSWYVQNFDSYDRTYGALGAVVGFLTWIWLSLVVLLLGAEIDCEVARRSRQPLA